MTRAPMCGIPYHAAETYISKLIENGSQSSYMRTIGRSKTY